MATLQDFDGLLLAFNNRFLTNLIGERYSLAQLRFKFLSIHRSPMYRTFATYEDFYAYFQSIFLDKDLVCLNGKVAVLESIVVTNESLKFPNKYHIRNITNNLNIQDDFKFDSFRKEFIESQVKTYNKYLNRQFTNYITDIATLTKFREQNYIESCWIDPDYFIGDEIQLLTV